MAIAPVGLRLTPFAKPCAYAAARCTQLTSCTCVAGNTAASCWHLPSPLPHLSAVIKVHVDKRHRHGTSHEPAPPA